MKRALTLLLVLCVFLVAGCTKDPVGKVVSGDDVQTLFEGLPWEIMEKAQAGDTIATKNPVIFLDFRHPVAFNTYNSAFGRFAGWDRKIVTSKGEENLKDFTRKIKQGNK
jgi:hypothetical protein